MRAVLDISESTLYPVLRRLMKDDCLVVHESQIFAKDAEESFTGLADTYKRQSKDAVREIDMESALDEVIVTI